MTREEINQANKELIKCELEFMRKMEYLKNSYSHNNDIKTLS